MSLDLASIEQRIIDIYDHETNASTGMAFNHIAKEVCAMILRNRIDQELNPDPVSTMELELANLEHALYADKIKV